MLDLAKFYENFYLTRQKIFKVISYIFSFFYIRIYLIIVLGLNLAIWLAVYFININVSQDLVILHYNVNFGVDLIGNVKRIFIIPVLGLLIILINTILLFSLTKHRNFKFFAHLLLVTCFIVNLFLLLGLAFIYLINFR